MDSLKTIPTPTNSAERLDLANLLYRKFQNRCFWHSRPDLIITEDLLPFVIKGLRAAGVHEGFKLAAKLQPPSTTPTDAVQEDPQCR